MKILHLLLATFALVLVSCSPKPGHLELDQRNQKALFNGKEIPYEEAEWMLRETAHPQTTVLVRGPEDFETTVEEMRPMAVMTHRMMTLSEDEMTKEDLAFKAKLDALIESETARSKGKSESPPEE